MATKVTIIGDGAMATLCAVLLHESGCGVRIWSAFPEQAQALRRDRINRRYFPDLPIPPEVQITGEDREAFRDSDLAVAAVPSQYIREVFNRLGPHCPDDLPICSIAKGIERGTLLRPTQILADVLGGARRLAALSGPCIAPEVARHLPATVAVASADGALAAQLQQAFQRPYFRVYTNADLVGLELAGAVKNVIAIAAGILDGLEAGCNAKAALITRGVVEMSRLGEALGGRRETFSGLAGMGDLVTTCFSPVGRNRSFGEAIGRGESVDSARDAVAGEVEGIVTTESTCCLAERCGVEMPICLGIRDVLFSGVRPAEAIARLMTRPPKSETV